MAYIRSTWHYAVVYTMLHDIISYYIIDYIWFDLITLWCPNQVSIKKMLTLNETDLYKKVYIKLHSIVLYFVILCFIILVEFCWIWFGLEEHYWWWMCRAYPTVYNRLAETPFRKSVTTGKTFRIMTTIHVGTASSSMYVNQSDPRIFS
jgi:hypothetical protein